MFKEYQEAEPVEVWKTLIGNKRRLSNPSVNDDSNRSKQRLDDSFLIDSSTSTENDVLNEGKVMDVKQYTETEGDVEAKQGVLSGTDEIKKIETAFDLRPVIQSEGIAKVSQDYYFGNATKRKVFNIKDKDDKSVNESDYSVLIDSIQWMDTFTSLIIGFKKLDEHLKDDESEIKILD
ncbi:unnamed protein product [Phytophthora lilii]|uniref:Unnamed protein product n=1 Tax=Phytophthora lilii TaxID=2077276 RepID=A0A9W6WPY1_9STRA|nr:unnamed protein product [Phytophthora lilii]